MTYCKNKKLNVWWDFRRHGGLITGDNQNAFPFWYFKWLFSDDL